MLKDQIQKDIIEAMKAKDEVRKEALKMIKAEIMKHEVSAADAEATDEVVTQILQRAVKQRKEAAEGFEKGGNADAAAKELQEAEIYSTYLPEMMSAEEISTIVNETIAEVGASGPSDMGKVMGAAKSKIGTSADGKRVSECVKAVLGSL